MWPLAFELSNEQNLTWSKSSHPIIIQIQPWYGGFLKWGTPKVTMGFNTKMVYIIWMIWEYPHFRKHPYVKIYYTAQMSYIGRAVVRHNIGQINPSLRFVFGKKDTWRDMESDRGRLHSWLAGSFNPSEKWWTSSVGMIFHSQLNGKLESHNPFHGSSHHQPNINMLDQVGSYAFRQPYGCIPLGPKKRFGRRPSSIPKVLIAQVSRFA